MSEQNEITVRRGEPIAFYRDKASHPNTPTTPSGLSIVSGSIAQKALKERLVQDGIPDSLTDYTTIEETARNIVETDRGIPVTVLSVSKRQRAIRAILADAQDNPTGKCPEIETIADRLPWETSSVIEQFDAEYVEWTRATAAGDDHADLEELIDRVRDDNPHAAAKTEEYITAFHQLDNQLISLVDAETYVTRNHMVRDAADAVPRVWHNCYDIDWVTFSTISVLDNPTMRLLVALAEFQDGPELHLFVGAGTRDFFTDRLRAAESYHGYTLNDQPDDDTPVTPPTSIGADLLAAAENYTQSSHTSAEIQLIETPDSRREVEHVFHDINKQLTDDADPQDLLVIGREALPYQTDADDIARLYNMPVHTEARQETKYMAAYALVEGIFELFATPQNDYIGFFEFLEPVRSGFSLPGHTGTWPIPDGAIRQAKRLITDQHSANLNTVRISDWIDYFQNTNGIDQRLVDYSRWVNSYRTSSPDAATLEELITDSLESYITDTLPGRTGETFGGIAITPNRIRATQKAPEYFAKRIQRTAESVGKHFDWATTNLSNANSDWREALTAFLGVVGDSDYGLPNEDADAIRLIDAGNSFYRSADRVYIMGLASGTFPTTSGKHSFIHPDIRTAARTHKKKFPFIYLNNDRAQYERDLDMYEASLRAATTEIVLTRPYKDRDNRDVTQSPFLDACDLENATRRLNMDELLPTPDRDAGESWTDLWPTISQKDRIRILMHYTGESITGPDAPSQQDLQELARYLATSDDADEIADRAEQFADYRARHNN